VPSITVSVLLFINGGLIIAGIIATVVQANFSSEEMANMGRTAGSTVLFGLILIGLGIWKMVSDRKVVSKQHPS
jgi:predicted transporter